MVFWVRLNKYRERHVYDNRVLQSSEVQTARPQQTFWILENFKYDELWHDLTEEQQKSKTWRNTLNTILNKRAGWTHAARAIMEYGLPKFERPAEPNDATEHINALGQFARDLAELLHGFASRMRAYRNTDGYQKNYQTLIVALGEKAEDCFWE